MSLARQNSRCYESRLRTDPWFSCGTNIFMRLIGDDDFKAISISRNPIRDGGQRAMLYVALIDIVTLLEF